MYFEYHQNSENPWHNQHFALAIDLLNMDLISIVFRHHDEASGGVDEGGGCSFEYEITYENQFNDMRCSSIVSSVILDSYSFVIMLLYDTFPEYSCINTSFVLHGTGLERHSTFTTKKRSRPGHQMLKQA
ncbi:hypothetical protein DERP_013259 [Dermatophagoides pteronyssinus]|uniref:Uncharacterized protein n=1 Tax=Dermatophagoides pteronyssinus TaxID=6956 RepID=A0ABQ8IRK0_DERPT|nr:hypothetical protein DERP_013259 [Dermatophagoides pteronyssinus]